MAKNYVIDGGTGELDVGGNTLANRFDLPDAMPPKRQNLGERFGFKKGSHWSDYINPGEWAQGYPSEEVREDFKQDEAGYYSIAGWSSQDARLVGAIQELSAKNDALEARILTLESA